MTGSFPNPVASKEEKATKKYGLEYARAIWATHTRSATTYNTRIERFINNRKYAEGLQSIQKYKNRLDLNNDSSYLNLDFNPVNRISTTIDNIVGKLMNQKVKIQCNPIDSESLTKFDDYRRKLYANKFLAKIAPQIEEKTGIPLIPIGEEIPKTNDDIEMHLKLNYKMDASMSMESAMQYVNNNNMFEETRRKVLKDIFTLKWAAIYRYYDSAKNIRHEYVDPVDLIVPYSKYDDFRNITYQALKKQYQIWELALQNPKFTEEDLFNIAKTQEGNNGNHSWEYGDSYEGYYSSGATDKTYMNFNITVMEFYYITQNVEKRVKKKNSKGGFFYNDKPSKYSMDIDPLGISVVDNGDSWGIQGENYTLKKDGATSADDAKEYFAKIKTDKRKKTSEVIEKKAKYRYEGRWIPGTEWLWDYKMTENTEREKISGSYSPEVELPISIVAMDIYDMQNKSLVERMIPLEDQMNLAHLKFQQLLIKAVPPGIKFDIDGLDGIISSMGEGTKPIDILKMYMQTGSFPSSSTRADGTYINSSVVETLPNGIGKDFQAYIATMQNYQMMINDVIGFNSAVDASSPDSNALVGVQKMAAQATQNALRPYYNAHLELILKSSKRVALMIQDSVQYNWDAFKMAIGEQAADTLKHGRKLAFNQFAISMMVAPDEEDKQNVRGLLQLGIKNQTLFASDAIRINQELEFSDKLAGQLLVLLETKNKENKTKESMQLQEQNSQVQTRAAQASEYAKTESAIAIMNAEKEIKLFEAQLKEKSDQANHIRTMEQIELKNQGNQSVSLVNSESKTDVQEIANKGKIELEEVKVKSQPKAE